MEHSVVDHLPPFLPYMKELKELKDHERMSCVSTKSPVVPVKLSNSFICETIKLNSHNLVKRGIEGCFMVEDSKESTTGVVWELKVE